MMTACNAPSDRIDRQLAAEIAKIGPSTITRIRCVVLRRAADDEYDALRVENLEAHLIQFARDEFSRRRRCASASL